MKKCKAYFGTIVWAFVSVVLVIALLVGCTVANTWNGPLTGFFGSVGTGGASSARYTATNTTQEDIEAHTAEVSAEIIREGAVLLKNDEVNGKAALPINAGSKISIFGVTSNYWASEQKISGTSNNAFTKALVEAGVEINTDLRSLYKQNSPEYGKGSDMGDGTSVVNWTVDELPYSHYESVESTYANFNDAAIVVLSRGGSEGSDTAMYMDAHGGTTEQSYFSLSAEEKDLLQNVTTQFERVILVIHSPSGLNMELLNEYNIAGVIWLAGTGNAELTSLADLIVGKSDFSGRLVDTHLYDNLAGNPATQNFGDFRFTNESGDLNGYSYVNYAEGIYVGYKYHETRYEDVLTGRGNAGTYDYSKTVAYPFGYGLSYNDYEWSNMQVSLPDENGMITVTVDVKNTGTLPGKDVVELYYQAPYTDYDIANGIEKSAVNLIGFDKTELIPAGETRTATIIFAANDMASWDSTYAHDDVTGAYFLSAGTYYLTAAANAHDAVNNILAAKGVSSGLVGITGKAAKADSAMVNSDIVYSENAYITVSTSGMVYHNNFTDTMLKDAVYLSRTNWSAVEDGSLVYQDGISVGGVSNVMAADGVVYTHNISAADAEKLSSKGWETAGNPTASDDFPAIVTAAQNGLSLADMFAEDGTVLPYDDEKWDTLLDQLTVSEMNGLYGYGGYGTKAIDSVNKPVSEEYDGPSKIYNLFSGSVTFAFPTEIMMAATWNTELLEAVGDCFGDQCLLNGIAGWYAPAMNTHRTAFGGRNFEYYSEDPVLAGRLAAAETRAVQAKGVYVYIKHFALNEQETNRGGNGYYATFAPEQAIRETYLKPFQMAVVEGGAKGVMASMNRVGFRRSVYNYDLLTSTVRNEWGFNGIIVTDYISGMSQEDIEAGIAAGLDLQLITSENPLGTASLTKAGVLYQLREAAHHILYTQADSLVMNGYSYGTPVYKILLAALCVVIGLYLALAGYLVIKYNRLAIKNGARVKLRRGDRILAIAGAVVLIILLVFVTVWFVTTALPALQFAFQI